MHRTKANKNTNATVTADADADEFIDSYDNDDDPMWIPMDVITTRQNSNIHNGMPWQGHL